MFAALWCKYNLRRIKSNSSHSDFISFKYHNVTIAIANCDWNYLILLLTIFKRNVCLIFRIIKIGNLTVLGQLPPPSIITYRTVAPWIITPRIIDHGQFPPRKIAPRTIAPQDNCPPYNCPRQFPPAKLLPEQLVPK